jgi:pyruvate/2-oxoglutarate dehydrogenase complex dihydrolipoamide acyltransferase (E2) component
MTEGNFVEWLVTNGQEVQVGDTIYSLETGKAIEEIAATATGKIHCAQEPGQVVQVGDLLGRIE